MTGTWAQARRALEIATGVRAHLQPGTTGPSGDDLLELEALLGRPISPEEQAELVALARAVEDEERAPRRPRLPTSPAPLSSRKNVPHG